MKFTKQEQSLIKLAAAHMAPQMVKKATLQDKLAEYGIGMSKKAADAPSYMNALNPLTRMPIATAAQAGARLASGFTPARNGSIEKAAPTMPQAGVQAGSLPSGKQKLLNAVQNYMRNAGKSAQNGALTGYVLGSALRGAKLQQSQSADVARGAINEIKTNGWPAVGMSPYTPTQMRAEGYPVYGNRFFKDLANLVRSPQDLNDSIEKMNREGVAPDTRRSDHTGLSSTFRANPRILAPQQ